MYRDTQSITRYYKLVSSTASAPSKPTTNPPSGWDDTEPSYTSSSTNTLYFCDLTVFSDGTWAYSTVSKSSSYEAAKEAYNKATNAQDTANTANDKIDGLEIGGKNLIRDASFADRTDVDNTYQKFGNNSVKVVVDNTDGTSVKYVSGCSASVSNNKLTIDLDDAKGQNLVFSIWLYVEEENFPTGYEFRVIYTDNGVTQWGRINKNYDYNVPSVANLTSGWNYLYGVYTIAEDTTRVEASFVANCSAGASGFCWVSSPKLEFGTRPTDFSIAPEDIIDTSVELSDQAKQDAIDESSSNIKNAIDELLIGDSSSIDGTEYEGSSLYEIVTSIITRTTSLEQNNEGFNFNFESLEETIRQLGDDVTTEFTERLKYIRFVDGAIILGDSDSLFQVEITNERISFIYNETTLSYLDSEQLNIGKADIQDATISENLRLGGFRWFKRPNGNLALKWSDE